MDSIIIKGGVPLKGNIYISGSKNASLPLMAAALLMDAPVILSNVPILSDIYTMQKLLISHGCSIDIVRTDQKQDIPSFFTLNIDPTNINNFVAKYDIVRKMRASIWVLAPLLTKYHEAKVSLPGGCAIGARQVDLHIAVLEAMGAKINIESGYIHATTKSKLNGCKFIFNKISVGATITGILAATLANGTTILDNCALEPEIVDLCNFLVKCGAQIKGIGTKLITITGVTSMSGCKYKIIPDRIETGTYMIAAAATGGDIKIHNSQYNLISSLAQLMQKIGIDIRYESDSENYDVIHVKHQGQINSTDIATEPYPGIATDLQAQLMTLMTIANGTSNITENIFENRFMHVPELIRMGANITINHNTATISGVKALSGAEVMASDLRASVSLIIAGLIATSKTKVKRIYHLDRGYQDLVKKLSKCGAKIYRITDDQI